MVSIDLVKVGWNNIEKIASDGWDGLVEVFTPSPEEIWEEQVLPIIKKPTSTTPGLPGLSPAVPEMKVVV